TPFALTRCLHDVPIVPARSRPAAPTAACALSLHDALPLFDGQRAIALLRHAGEDRRVLASRTEDAGRTWSEPTLLEPSNPDSSLAAIATPRHGLLVALNDLKKGRFRLSLYGTEERKSTRLNSSHV